MSNCPFYKTFEKTISSKEVSPHRQQANVYIETFKYCSHIYADQLHISKEFLLTLRIPGNQLKCHGEEHDPDCHLKYYNEP